MKLVTNHVERDQNQSTDNPFKGLRPWTKKDHSRERKGAKQHQTLKLRKRITTLSMNHIKGIRNSFGNQKMEIRSFPTLAHEPIQVSSTVLRQKNLPFALFPLNERGKKECGS